MSLKYKIPFITLAVFIINLIALLIFYKLYMVQSVENSFSFAEQAIGSAIDDLSEAIDGTTYNEALSYLSSLENKNDLIFTLEAVETGKKTLINASTVYMPGFTQTKIISLSNEPYIFIMQKNIDLLSLRSRGIISELIYFECIVLFILFVSVGILLHFRYVKPLISLGENMARYTSGLLTPMPARHDEIGYLQNKFSELSASLCEEKQMQNRIIASISHDIKTPLTSVLGYTERILKKDFEEKQKNRYLTTIYNQATDIGAIVEEFDEYLSCTLPDSDQIKTYKISYIAKMLDDEYTALLREKNIYFTIKNCCDEKIAVQIDLLKLRRVFANIIANSTRHAKIQQLKIDFYARCDTKTAVFTFIDNGRGIDEGDLPHIFEPFYTSDQGRRISGLGLSICKKIIESHNGTIEVENSMPLGVKVVIKIPITIQI
jgi:signal transduction histidine kinase